VSSSSGRGSSSMVFFCGGEGAVGGWVGEWVGSRLVCGRGSAWGGGERTHLRGIKIGILAAVLLLQQLP